MNKKKTSIQRFVDNISQKKINEFCKKLENQEIGLERNFFEIKNILKLNSKEEKYFLDICSLFKNYEELILIIKSLVEIKKLEKKIDDNTTLAWSSPIKFHEKIDQTYSVFLDMIKNANDTIVFVGYAMTDKENEQIFDAFKEVAKQKGVKIKIIFDKATKAKKWGKWTKSPKKIISNAWGDIRNFPQIYSYEGEKSSLHAKFLIIDEKEILITSANMTDRAMTRNLEMGIRHKGKVAKDAVELVNLLIDKKIISRVTYD